jgi:hypothetical protein
MKMTLLEMVQDILSDMDSDDVNSIDDTVEALQVAQIIKTSYYEMVSNRNWASHETLVQLESLSDSSIPNYLRIPSNVTDISWIRYNRRRPEDVKERFSRVIYKPPVEFMDILNARDDTQSNIQVVVDPTSGINLNIRNDMPPQYWTSFDDSILTFDSWEKAQETTLQTKNSQAMVNTMPSFTMEDNFVPDLPVNAFSALLHESKSTAFVTLKQVANEKAEQKANRQQRWLSRNERLVGPTVRYPDYGRKTPKTSSRQFDKETTNAYIVQEPDLG